MTHEWRETLVISSLMAEKFGHYASGSASIYGTDTVVGALLIMAFDLLWAEDARAHVTCPAFVQAADTLSSLRLESYILSAIRSELDEA